ncbi:unnamed protein product, partial [Musa acuminata var. zebrina]
WDRKPSSLGGSSCLKLRYLLYESIKIQLHIYSFSNHVPSLVGNTRQQAADFKQAASFG